MVGPHGVQGSRRTRTTRGRMAPPDPGRTVRRAWTTGGPGSRATRPTATRARAGGVGRGGRRRFSELVAPGPSDPRGSRPPERSDVVAIRGGGTGEPVARDRVRS